MTEAIEPVADATADPSGEATTAADDSAGTGQEPGIGSKLSDVLSKAGEGDQSAVEKLTKMVEDSRKTIGRQGRELGELRKLRETMEASQQDNASVATEDYAELFTDPKGFLDKLETRMEKKILSRVDPELRSVRETRAVNSLAGNNALVQEILSNPKMVNRLKEISEDPDALAMLESAEQNKISAAVLMVAGELFGKQKSDVKNAPKPKRPENAGMASPKGDDLAPAGKTKEPPKAKNMDEAIVNMFGEAHAKGVNLRR